MQDSIVHMLVPCDSLRSKSIPECTNDVNPFISPFVLVFVWAFILANVLPFELMRMFYKLVSLLVTSLFTVHIQ